MLNNWQSMFVDKDYIRILLSFASGGFGGSWNGTLVLFVTGRVGVEGFLLLFSFSSVSLLNGRFVSFPGFVVLSSTVTVVLVGVDATVVGGQKEQNKRNSNRGPGNTVHVLTQLGVQPGIREGVLGLSRSSSEEGNSSQSEQERTSDEEGVDSSSSGRTERNHQEEQRTSCETQSDKEQTETNTGQVVVSVSVVDEILRNVLGGAKVIDWRNRIARLQVDMLGRTIDRFG
ncbi:hypothetical protein WICPIJ_001586 [Wickerhamomyces pijperi]|uniref:Uncharacterized protein n=1 Tax=Wickerhamomyces pijperi TaxID=599730 RepID=A0A9P8QD06_WICPI|nr:hypothetical protein WICPIJ_001586 [Wickerhamomyces pijperi]